MPASIELCQEITLTYVKALGSCLKHRDYWLWIVGYSQNFSKNHCRMV